MDSQTEPVGAQSLLVALHRGQPEALHEQLERALREQVRSGKLPSGTRLPSSRTLAVELGVSRGVVLEAYSQLAAEGYLTASQGAATRVAQTSAAERPPLPAMSLGRPYRFDLRPGVPDLGSFPREEWLRCLRLELRAAPFELLGDGDPRGLPRLRNELMGYLGRARAAAPEPEHTLICAGFTQALSVLCRVLRDRGLERIAIEEPGCGLHLQIAQRAGLEPVPVAVDEDGMSVEELERSGCEVAILTPAHQFPTGVVLSPERRARLLEWAEERDGLIVEDDYDSELRYDRVPVGALQGLAPERVCHIGSVSARLAPGLRLGWILSPSWLTGALSYEKAIADGGAPALDALTLAGFIARGGLDRHLRRQRLRYRSRRELLERAVARWLPDARVSGIPAGLHALVRLAGNVAETDLLSRAYAEGIALVGLGSHRLRAGEHGGGLVLGFGNISEPGLERALRRLGELARPV